MTDHRPLCMIFGENEGVPPLAAALMQRWALLLSAYIYKTEYISEKSNYSANCMSRLPHSVVFDPFGDLPVTADKIARTSLMDPDIATVLIAVQHGSWSQLLIRPTLLPYHIHRQKISVIDNCLMGSRRVVIP